MDEADWEGRWAMQKKMAVEGKRPFVKGVGLGENFATLEGARRQLRSTSLPSNG